MPTAADIILIRPDYISLHPEHPASNLHPDVAFRLLDGHDISTTELVSMACISPLIVIGAKNRWRLVAGWHLWMALRQRNVTKPITCICHQNLGQKAVAEMGNIDLLVRSRLYACDEVARRLRAILSYTHLAKKGHVSRAQLHRLKHRYNLPTRKQNSLDKLLTHESHAVWSAIQDAPAPLGLRKRTSNAARDISSEDWS